MNDLEVLFLISRLRYQDFLQEAEQERLGKLFLKSHTENRNVGIKIGTWVQRRLPHTSRINEPVIQAPDMSIPCCPAAES